MKTLTLDLPIMYGDHHVLEVRRILLAMPGIADVYASSAFQVAEITYDPAQIDAEAIEARLDEAGYLGDLLLPIETGNAVTENNGAKTHFRHSASFKATGKSMSFAQDVQNRQRPLWPCPGLGNLPMIDEGEQHG